MLFRNSYLLIIFISVCFVGCSSFSSNQAKSSAPTSLANWLEVMENGATSENFQHGYLDSVLSSSLETYQNTTDPRKIDPSAGSNFIEHVAHLELEHLYEVATEMYYWSFDATGWEFEEELLEEIKKSKPVFDQNRYDDIARLYETDVQQAAQAVRAYWISLDPTPSTPVNERLIEHWQRIAYSKQQFTKNDNTIYGTDDRALTYIKYGQPDKIVEGRFYHSQHSIKYHLETYMGMMVVGSVMSDVDQFLLDAQSSFPNTDYEVWVYNSLSVRGKIVKIYGTAEQSRVFQEVESLADFIPSRAFSSTSSITVSREVGFPPSPGKINPGYFTLISLNEQLAYIDSYFQDFYVDLNTSLTYAQFSPVKHWVLSQDQVNTYQMYRIEDKAPDEHSTFLSEMVSIEVEAKQYTFFDADNEPYFLTVMDSYPQEEFLNYLVQIQDENKGIDSFELKHTVSAVSLGETQMLPATHTPDIPFENKGDVYPAQSIFKVPLLEQAEQRFVAEFYDKEPKEREAGIYPNELILVGNYSLEQSRKIKSVDELHVSDLVLGYRIDSSQVQDEIPFLISINEEIPEFSNLFVYYQINNLELDEAGNSKVEIEFWSEERKRLGLFSRDRINSIQFSFEDRSPQITENIELDLATQEPGNYTLNFIVRDLVSGREVTKKVNFEIFGIEE